MFDFTEDSINSKEFIAIDRFIAKSLFMIRIESLARGFYFILTSLLGSGLSIYLGKNIFEIDRPHQYAYYQENYFSFPSGHSTIAVSFYGLLLYFLIQNHPTFKIKGLLISIAFLF